MEVARLRAEVQELKSTAEPLQGSIAELERSRQVFALAAPAVARPAPEFLTSTETPTEWQRACSEAESYIYVACFTFDLQPVVAELANARTRGLTARLLYSRQDRTLATNRGARLQELLGRGAEVRGHRGSRLHAKVLLTERMVIVGGCNFTRASIHDVERGVKLAGMSEAELIEQRDWFDRLFTPAEPFQGGVGAPAPRTPQR